MTHAQIIVALGDTASLAEKFGLKKAAVSQWKKRGIAPKWKPHIAMMAKEKGVLLPADFLFPIPRR